MDEISLHCINTYKRISYDIPEVKVNNNNNTIDIDSNVPNPKITSVDTVVSKDLKITSRFPTPLQIAFLSPNGKMEYT
jgi:hypothetical protein